MRTLHDPIRVFIAQKIHAAMADYARSLGGEVSLSVQDIFDQLVEPPNSAMGDLAFGCFPFAKALKKAPPQIAAALKEKIPVGVELQNVQAAGPYLNLTLNPQFFAEQVLQPILSGETFRRELSTATLKTMIEYSQPNTHKEIHVGHMRNACLGDALVRMHRYSGIETISATFPGDVGTHVAKCLWYLRYHNHEAIPATGKGEWLGKIYAKANLLLEEQIGSDQEAINREQLTAILQQLENQQGEFYDLWKETRQWSIDLMKHVYAWAGITFDQWYWESDVDAASVKYVRQLYADGKLSKSEGAIGMDLSDENLGFCLLLKSDGNGLYATKDVELARRKFQDFHIQKSIYIVDVRQELHLKQVFKVLERLGFAEAKNCFHLKYNFVELPDGAMSSRKGNIVPLMELVHRMEEMVKTNYLSRYSDEWSQEEVQTVATQVAKGAIKYGMLRIDTAKKIVFDMNEWLKLDGESGPFIQYSGARINSLMKKLNYDLAEAQQARGELLVHPAERSLLQSLLNFNTQVVSATESEKPHLLCTYLYDLAKRFNVFYHECSIGQADTADLKTARLALAAGTGRVLQEGLGLLGIPVPERM
jgi:arginyl-tRNA synthetase